MNKKGISIFIAMLLLILIANAFLTACTTKENGKATYFSEDAKSIKQILIDANVKDSKLELVMGLEGLDLSKNTEAQSPLSKYPTSLVCNPLLSIEGSNGSSFESREISGEGPYTVKYSYNLVGPLEKELSVKIDWTLGPCGTMLDESNVKAEQNPLLMNTRFEIVLPTVRSMSAMH